MPVGDGMRNKDLASLEEKSSVLYWPLMIPSGGLASSWAPQNQSE